LKKEQLYKDHIHTTYLITIWLIGVALIIYLCLPFISKGSGLYLIDLIDPKKQSTAISENVNNGQSTEKSNQALLFVTINKKQFLTKFVTYISDEDLAAKELADSSTEKNNKSFIIVGRKKSTNTQKSKDDFVIKAAPKI
jgi:succinyl-CoA synthetase beta subunit